MYGSKVSFNENPNCTETSQFPGFYMIRVKGFRKGFINGFTIKQIPGMKTKGFKKAKGFKELVSNRGLYKQ